ncbi:MAG: hypothetical protein AABO58_11950 [Acidobacteriota bacterium]
MADPQDPESEIWKRYLALQLTPAQKAELQKRAEAEMARARREGGYEKLLELRGKVHLEYDIEELRKDRD